MTFGCQSGWLPWFGLAVALAVLLAPLPAAERAAKPVAETVEMFSAMEEGRIGVRLIPKDSTEGRVLIENKTDRPLTVRLPDAFAGVQVLAQLDDGGLGGERGGSSRSQSMGGGMGGMGGMGGGMFNVLPEKVGGFKVPTVCLEHGKREPRAAMTYEIRPIEEFTDEVEVHEVCRMLGRGEIPQRVAQAAAWHLANDMSWRELAAEYNRYANGMRVPYFSPMELRAGMQVVGEAVKRAKLRGDGTMEKSLSER